MMDRNINIKNILMLIAIIIIVGLLLVLSKDKNIIYKSKGWYEKPHENI